MTTDELKSHLLQLPQDIRADLARLLIDSPADDFVDAEEAAFVGELIRRQHDIEEGTAVGRPTEEVVVDLRKTFP